MITNTHLSRYDLTVNEYLDLFPGEEISSEERNARISLSLIGNTRSIGSPRSHTEEFKKTMSVVMTGNQNGIGNSSKLGYTNSPEHRKAVSQALLRDYALGIRSPGKRKGSYESSKPTNSYPNYYRSKLELEFMKQLDADDTIICWMYESLRIPYGNSQTTIPDFVVEYAGGSKSIIEVKGTYFLEKYLMSQKHKAIVDYAHNRGYSYEVISEGEIYGSH